MRSIQDKLATDILSSETQYTLLSELSCEQDPGNENLSTELNDLANKINDSESNLKGNSDVTELKRYYSVLEIKDFLLTKKINEKCKGTFVPLLYFYTTANNCTECVKQGFVLTELREKYPNLRVYSFDYSLDLSALRALIKIYKIDDTKLPAIVLNEHTYTGFQTVEDIEKIDPAIVKLLPTSPATTTTTSATTPKNTKK
jgi:hypothetical protein